MIVNDKRKNCRLPLINFDKFWNVSIIEKYNTIKYKKCDTKKVNQDHIVVDKRFRPNVLIGSKVPKGFSNMFELHKPVFNYDVFVMVFIFLFF